MDTMVELSLGRRYMPVEPVRTELKIPHAFRIFVEGLLADALVRADLDHRPVDGRLIDWGAIWRAGDGASSTEQALGRIVTAARAAADQLSQGNADPGTPHLHFAIFELGPEKQWWKGKAVNPYAGLVAAVKRAE